DPADRYRVMPRTRFALPVLVVAAVAAVAATAGATADHPRQLPEPDSIVRINTLPDGLRVSAVHMRVHRGGERIPNAMIQGPVNTPRPTNAHPVLTIGPCNATRCDKPIAPPPLGPAGKTISFGLFTKLPAGSVEIFGALRKPGVTDVFSDN